MPKKPITLEQRQKREQAAFRRRIVSVFKNAGFLYLPVAGKERVFGSRRGELDAVFIFENIVLVCEDTITRESKNIKSHLKDKKHVFDEIADNQDDLIDWLKSSHSDKFSQFDEYDNQRYKIFFLYCTRYKFNPSPEDLEFFKSIKIVEQSTLNYFYKLSRSIRFSSRNDIFRFLGLRSQDIGQSNSLSERKTPKVAIICPPDSTGHGESGIRLVSFMLSAELLMRNAYVLRKDNWETHMQLYQRLIEKGRIEKIRKYVVNQKTAFYNNIIVSLPDNVSFHDDNGSSVNLEDIQDFSGEYRMQIPNEFNSICVIDGQHRIFAHYEGDDKLEKDIARLRSRFHLLVTGLIFPKDMPSLERRKYESEIFLDINSNAKPVPPDLLLFIEELKDPFSESGVARKALVRLNQEPVFHNQFELSLTERSKIKIASIIKFALRNLVAIDDANPESLYGVWVAETGKSLNERSDTLLLDEYVEFIVGKLGIYFRALKSAYSSEWDDDNSKILSTTSINGFIIALRRSLSVVGLKEFEYYKEAFGRLDIDFSKQNFPYISSRYNKFSIQILRECFNIVKSDDDDTWVENH